MGFFWGVRALWRRRLRRGFGGRRAGGRAVAEGEAKVDRGAIDLGSDHRLPVLHADAGPVADRDRADVGHVERLHRTIRVRGRRGPRSEEHTSELQSLMRISY